MADLQAVHDELRRRLSVHEDVFTVSDDLTDARARGPRGEGSSPDTYLLLGAPTETYPGGQMFASVKTGARRVSVHLLALYVEPATADGLSPELARRRQGKTCFNFTTVDEALLDELDEVVGRARELYAERGWLAR